MPHVSVTVRPGRRGDSELTSTFMVFDLLYAQPRPAHVAVTQRSGKQQATFHSAARPTPSGKGALILSVSGLKPAAAFSASRGSRPVTTRSQHRLTALHPERATGVLRAPYGSIEAPPRSQSSPPTASHQTQSFTGRYRVFPKGPCLARGGWDTMGGLLRGKPPATKVGTPKCPPSRLHGSQHSK